MFVRDCTVAGEGQSANILGGSVSLLNVAVDEGGDGLSRGVDLVLGLGHGQLLHHLLKRLERLGVLGLDVLGIMRSSRRHVVGVGRGGRCREGGKSRWGGPYIWTLAGPKKLLARKDRVNLSGGYQREESDSQPFYATGHNDRKKGKGV